MKRRRKSKVKFEEFDQLATTTAEFSFYLTRVAISQICQSIGYEAADSSALNSLTLITTKYLQSLAGLAASFSNTANRTEVNIFDIVNGIQDFSLSTCDYFPGGSMVQDTESHCLIKSAALRNISDFVTNSLEIPFAKPLPKPEIDGSSLGDLIRMPCAPSTRSQEVNHIPAWLPPFPDESLYLEHSAKDGSYHLWENSDTVIGCKTLPESSKSESCRGKSDGSLPQRRTKVRFKVERGCSNGGGSCTTGLKLERCRDNDDGESDREFGEEKKIRRRKQNESCRGKSDGSLPQRRTKVRFKVERGCSNGGGSCTTGLKLERCRDNDDGESDREFGEEKKIRRRKQNERFKLIELATLDDTFKGNTA